MFEKTPSAEQVGRLLTKVVADAFQNSIAEESDRQWLLRNGAFAAKMFRFLAAAAWVAADVYIQANSVTKPAPESFMKVWREANFEAVLTFFSEPSEQIKQLIWSQMFDDIDEYRRILSEQIRVNTPFLLAAVGRHWFEETQQIPISKGYNSPHSGLRLLLIAAALPETVDAVLSKHCR